MDINESAKEICRCKACLIIDSQELDLEFYNNSELELLNQFEQYRELELQQNNKYEILNNNFANTNLTI
ncbi:8768_t:CDS:2 [Racocetra fulgida]|uniref:8768_t:CDS:1 n=1 Tax=Racocetra fulgida TaxID=60492 RepID=A0A9N9B8B6_9GLOM|nr:8768_t:CDS:2 [Racocetra fulgida]